MSKFLLLLRSLTRHFLTFDSSPIKHFCINVFHTEYQLERIGDRRISRFINAWHPQKTVQWDHVCCWNKYTLWGSHLVFLSMMRGRERHHYFVFCTKARLHSPHLSLSYKKETLPVFTHNSNFSRKWCRGLNNSHFFWVVNVKQNF